MEENSSDTRPAFTLADTVRFASGFAAGGITALYFDLGYLMVVAVAAGIVFVELIYGFLSAWYTAMQHNRATDDSR